MVSMEPVKTSEEIPFAAGALALSCIATARVFISISPTRLSERCSSKTSRLRAALMVIAAGARQIRDTAAVG
jgi:hypothetical protein